MPRTKGAPPADAAAVSAVENGQKKKRARSAKKGSKVSKSRKARAPPATRCDQCRSNGLPCDGKSPCGSCVSKFMEKHRHTGIDGIDLKKDGVGCSYNVTDEDDNHNKRRRTARQQQKQKPRFRMNGGIIDLSSDAIVINGPLEGTKHFGPQYGMEELCTDMQREVERAKQSAENLMSMTKGDKPAESQRDLVVEYERSFLSMSRSLFLLSQWKVAHDRGEIAKAPVVAHTDGKRKARGISLEDEAKASSSISQLLLAANNARGGDDDDDSDDVSSNDDDDDETGSNASEEK